jgi:hypothetical protein
MGGARTGAGRHKRDCDCEKCKSKYGHRPVDGDLARRIKAKIQAEKKWLRIVEVETQLMETTGKTAPLRTSLIYLDNRDLGNCVDNVNHMHDKPLEVNATLTLGEGMRLAMQKAEERVRSSK